MDRIDLLASRLDSLVGESDDLLIAANDLPVGQDTPLTTEFSTSNNPFEDILSKAIEGLTNVSKTEINANNLIDGYLRGTVDVHDAMIASAKMGVEVQMAST